MEVFEMGSRSENQSHLCAMASNTNLVAQSNYVNSIRDYRPSGWVKAYVNARSTILNFDYWWYRLAGERIVASDLKAKEPPVPLLSVARLETDAFIAFREAAKKNGLDTSIAAAGQNVQYKTHLLAQARLSNPMWVDVHNRMYHHMWHVWVLPPAAALSMIGKYIAIGSITGTIAGAIWRYGYHLPERRKIDAFYKTLYAEHPEFWPALAMQKNNVRTH